MMKMKEVWKIDLVYREVTFDASCHGLDVYVLIKMRFKVNKRKNEKQGNADSCKVLYYSNL